MTLLTLINRDCTIVRRLESDEEDDYGNQKPVENLVETVCELQQKQRDEADAQGEVSDTDWVAFFLPGEDIRTGDALVVDGEMYEFVGDPWVARNPLTQQGSHVECTLRRTAGSDDEEAGS